MAILAILISSISFFFYNLVTHIDIYQVTILTFELVTFWINSFNEERFFLENIFIILLSHFGHSNL